MPEAAKSWSEHADDLVRAASGGFLFGIPLFYTMEVWWIGSQVPPGGLLAIMAATFVLVWVLNHTEGFRRRPTKVWLDVSLDSLESMAVGYVCAALVLWLIGEIQPTRPGAEAIGKIIIEGLPFALGAALASAFLSGSREDGGSGDSADSEAPSDEKRPPQEPDGAGEEAGAGSGSRGRLGATLSDLGATAIGALIVAFNIAPTEEVPLLNAAAGPLRLIAYVAASLLISYAIVFAAGFSDQQGRHRQKGLFQRPFTETVASYVVALFCAAGMLVLFEQLRWGDPWTHWLNSTLILGLPACIGGAAGRLAV